MSTFLDQAKNINKMANSKPKQAEFNDRMVNLTWHYQKKYKFKTDTKNGHEFWNNEADAFKHTFGSALMEFEMGSFGSLAGGIDHEATFGNNPPNEKNMDYWNNNQGRQIAKEIKKEYAEKEFRNFSKEKQEDIIAHKVMVKMKNGELITHPDDKRIYKGTIEAKLEPLIKKIHEVYNDNKKSGANTSNPNNGIVNFNGIKIGDKSWDELSDDVKAAFWEGFDSNSFCDNNNNWTKKFNITNPDENEGHWVTLPNKKHLFIKNN